MKHDNLVGGLMMVATTFTTISFVLSPLGAWIKCGIIGVLFLIFAVSKVEVEK